MGKKIDTLTQTELLTHIQQGDERLLNQLYAKYRGKFLNWARRRYQCDEEDAAEVYQKAFVIFYFNIKNGKLAELTSNLETYFFGIGKNVFRERFKDKYRVNTTEIDERFEPKEMDLSIADKYSRIHQKTMVHELLGKLGEVCQKVLLLYYFKRFSMESIAENLGYKNELVAKKKKYQCLQKLRNMVGDNPELLAKLMNG